MYPTKQQTGAELFELVHLASAAFPRVALYFENSILKPDLALLAASSAVVTKYARTAQKVSLEAPADVEVSWTGAGVLVDGKPWPVHSRVGVRVPAGAHTIEAGPRRDEIAIVDLNARLRSASVEGDRASFEYSSDSRAIVRFDRNPRDLELDGAALSAKCGEKGECSVMLPPGDHRVTSR